MLDAVVSLEGLAVVLALAYLLLAARENMLCWFCALVSSALYVSIFFDAGLYMETGLNIFYVLMAIFGWYEWKLGGAAHNGVRIVSMQRWQHVAMLLTMLLLALVNGWAMRTWTDAAWPFVDSFITWGSILTTVLVVRKVLENWLYWLLLDGMAVFVYLERGLYLTALLFVLYLLIVVFGYLQWRREFRSYVAQA